MYKKILAILLVLLIIVGISSLPSKQELHVLTWYDLFPPELVEKFEEETNIKVVFDFVDSDDAMESKNLNGFDLITTTVTPYLARIAQRGSLKKIDFSKMPHFHNVNKEIMDKYNEVEVTRGYGIPFFYGTFVIVYNEAYMKELGFNFVPENYDVFFKEDVVKQLSPYGISFLEEYSNVMAIVLGYLGYDYNTTDPQQIFEAYQLLKKTRPHIRRFSSMRFINDLLIRDMIIALATTHETFKALNLDETGALKYVQAPGERYIWFDCFAFPKGAKDAAYQFVDFFLRPENAIELSKETFLANAVSHNYRHELPSYLFLENINEYVNQVSAVDPEINKLFLAYWKSILQKVPLEKGIYSGKQG